MIPSKNTMLFEKVVALAKRRGFIYPGSDLYGGLANTYDYGPVGVELLLNIKKLWWETFVQKRDDMVGLDASLISHHKIWEASGHTTGFADAMIDCKNCKARMRADHLLENFIEQMDTQDRNTLITSHAASTESAMRDFVEALQTGKVEGLSPSALDGICGMFTEYGMVCPNCGKKEWTAIRKFNLLFPVQLGIVEGEQGLGYLRGETAQGIFINFKNIVNSTRVRLPFGIAQLGKSFRNEITPGNSIFRTIEFEQGEIEYFFDPRKTKWEIVFDTWKAAMYSFVTGNLGIKKDHVRWREHDEKERSFYSKKTEDLEYLFPFGFKELWGIAYRTNYDLTRHQEVSKKELSIIDPQTNEKILPHVIEPAVGINRLLLMVLCEAYTEEEKRIVLRLPFILSPVQVAVFPLLANKPELVTGAESVYSSLKKDIEGKVVWDDRGNIGKRYLAQDEIGTPFCVTIDFQSIEDKTVTVRSRDTMQQERVKIEELVTYLKEHLKN